MNIVNHITTFIKSKHLKTKSLTKKTTTFSRSSNIILMDSSTKDDIELGEHVKMYGTLISQNHGKIICNNYVTIGSGSIIGSVIGVYIKEGATIAHNVTIMDNNNHPVSPYDRKIIYCDPSGDSIYRRIWRISKAAPIIIGENTWIGAHSIINKGVSIGENSIVATGSVVVKDVPSNCIVAGNPGMIVKTGIDMVDRVLISRNDV